MRAGEALFAAGSAYLASPRLNATYMQRSEETGLFGPLTVAAAQLCRNFASFVTAFSRLQVLRLTGAAYGTGKGPGLR